MTRRSDASPTMLSATKTEQTPLTRQLNSDDPLDRARGAGHDGRHVRPGHRPRRSLRHDLHHGHRPCHRRRPGGPAHRDADHPLDGRGRPRQAERHHQGPLVGRDAGLHVGHQLGQDGHADHEPDDGRRGRQPVRPLHDHGHRLRHQGHGAARGGVGPEHRRRHPAVPRGQRRQARERQGRGRSHRGSPARPGRQGRPGHRRDARPPGAPRDAALRPHLQADGHVQQGPGG